MELIGASHVDCRIDVWSAGCTLCELFTGNVTFPGVSNNDMLRVIQNLKGPIPHKMIKRHIKSYLTMGREPMFTDDFKFKFQAVVGGFSTNVTMLGPRHQITDREAADVYETHGGHSGDGDAQRGTIGESKRWIHK